MPDRSAFSLKKGIIGRLSVAPLLGTGFLSIGGTLTADRTATFPDASITVAGSAAALTSGQIVVAQAGGLLGGSSGFTYSGTLLTLNQSGATLAAGSSGTVVQIAAATGVSRLLVDSFGTGVFSAFAGRGARGTSTTPTALQLSDEIIHLSAFGYGATGYSAVPRGFLSIFAAENWTDTAQGTRIGFQTTAPGGIVTSEKLRIWGDGGVSVGGAYAASPGVGALAAASLTATGLTSGRVPFVTTGGLLIDDASFSYVSPGNLVVGISAGSSANIALNAAAATNRGIFFRTAANNRWFIYANNAAEAGADVGSNLLISAYTDANVFIDTPISITRAATGPITLVRPTVISQGTITAAASNLSGTATWNNAGVTFNGWKLNITDTASAAASTLLDLQLGGASKFQVIKSGEVGLSVAPTVGAGLLQLTGGTTIANGILLGNVGIFRSATNALTINATAGVIATGPLSATTLTATGLTSGRLPFVTTGGLLLDHADMTANPAAAGDVLTLGSNARARPPTYPSTPLRVRFVA